MKFYQSFFSKFLVLIFVINGCAIFEPNNSKRKPSGAFHQAHDPVGLDLIKASDKKTLYKYKGLLKAPPLRFLTGKVVELGLKIYIKTLPLDKDVEKRVLKNIGSKAYAKTFVPFLMGLRELYTVKKKIKKFNFDTYIKEKVQPGQYPGLEHDYFSFEEKKEEKSEDSEEDKTPLGHMIASVITIFDQMVLADSNFSLETRPQRTPELVERVNPHIKKILSSVLSGMDPHSETYEAVNAIASDRERMKSATASLIDAIHLYAYKHYQMMANLYAHKERMQKWYDTHSESEIAQYFEESLNRKYTVQIMVDGLQGNLMESLSLADLSSPFLNKIYDEHINSDQFRPSITHNTLDPIHDKFLNYVVGNKNSAPLADEFYLPFFKNLYKNHLNGIVKQGVSTTPTISVRNIPIIQTGAKVTGSAGTGLPNFHFVDRKKDRAYYFFGNDAVLLEELTKESGMKTIPDRLPQLNSLNCMATYESGADWSVDPLLNLALGEGTRDFGEMICLEELRKRVRNEVKSRELKQKYLEFVKEGKKRKNRKKNILKKLAKLENETMPEYLSYYNPWPDHFAHFTGPFADEIISTTGELNRLDYWLERITVEYREAGLINQTLFTMAGDHGLSPVKYTLNPEKAVFDKLIEEGYQIKMTKISSDEGEGPRLNDHVNPPSMKGYDIVVASTAGGNHMMDLFIDFKENYERQPLYEHLINYKLQSGQSLNIVDQILDKLADTLDYMVVRDEDCSEKSCAVKVLTKKNGKLEQALIKRRGRKVYYHSETDLLEVGRINPYSAVKLSKKGSQLKNDLIEKCILDVKLEEISSWCSEVEWRKLTAFTPRPDSINQLAHLYDTPLAGTINVFPTRYVGYNSKVPGRHAGELFEEKDAFIGVWGEGLQLDSRIISEINGSIAPTSYQWLTNKKIHEGDEGFGYRSLLLQEE